MPYGLAWKSVYEQDFVLVACVVGRQIDQLALGFIILIANVHMQVIQFFMLAAKNKDLLCKQSCFQSLEWFAQRMLMSSGRQGNMFIFVEILSVQMLSAYNTCECTHLWDVMHSQSLRFVSLKLAKAI